MATLMTRRRFTVAEFERMAAAGILSEDDRVELIDGEVVTLAPIGRRHAACVDCLTQSFLWRLGEVVSIRVQGPIQLEEHSEPRRT